MKTGAVRESRQIVALCGIDKLRFEDLPLRDVEGDADHAQRHAGGIVPHLGRGP